MKNKPNVTAVDYLETAEESNSTNLPQVSNLSNSVSPSSVPTTLNSEGFWDQENREIQSNGSYDKLENLNIVNIINYIDQSNRFAIGSLDKQVLLLALFRSLCA